MPTKSDGAVRPGCRQSGISEGGRRQVGMLIRNARYDRGQSSEAQHCAAMHPPHPFFEKPQNGRWFASPPTVKVGESKLLVFSRLLFCPPKLTGT